MSASTVQQWSNTRNNIHANDGYSAQKVKRFLDIRQQFLAEFVAAGGTVLLGSDAPQVFNVPGDALHVEMALMQQAGMTPLQILQSASSAPAKFFGKQQEFGDISVGKSADFVLLAHNPLENITNTRSIQGVMTRGHWLSAQQISDGLNAICRHHAGDHKVTCDF